MYIKYTVYAQRKQIKSAKFPKIAANPSTNSMKNKLEQISSRE